MTLPGKHVPFATQPLLDVTPSQTSPPSQTPPPARLCPQTPPPARPLPIQTPAPSGLWPQPDPLPARPTPTQTPPPPDSAPSQAPLPQPDPAPLPQHQAGKTLQHLFRWTHSCQEDVGPAFLQLSRPHPSNCSPCSGCQETENYLKSIS